MIKGYRLHGGVEILILSAMDKQCLCLGASGDSQSSLVEGTPGVTTRG